MATKKKQCARNGSDEVEDVEHWLLRCAAWKTLREPLLVRVQQLQEGGYDNLAALLLSYACRNCNILSMIDP